jgi:hypothetical protein
MQSVFFLIVDEWYAVQRNRHGWGGGRLPPDVALDRARAIVIARSMGVTLRRLSHAFRLRPEQIREICLRAMGQIRRAAWRRGVVVPGEWWMQDTTLTSWAQ